jgi:hypothetical protein
MEFWYSSFKWIHQEHFYSFVLKQLQSRYGVYDNTQGLIDAIKYRFSMAIAIMPVDNRLSSNQLCLMAYCLLAKSARLRNPWFHDILKDNQPLFRTANDGLNRLLTANAYSESVYVHVAPGLTFSKMIDRYKIIFYRWFASVSAADSSVEKLAIHRAVFFAVGTGAILSFAVRRGILSTQPNQ